MTRAVSGLLSYVRTVRRFNRDVRLYLSTTALLGFTVFGGIYPVLFNLYLLRLGYGPDFVGLINSLGGLTFALGSLPAGVLSSRWGGRRTMIAGYGLAVLAFALLPLAEFMVPAMCSVWLAAAVVVRGLGFSLYWVNARPFLMGATEATERDHVYAVQSALFPLTGFAGSLVAGILPGVFAGVLGVSLDHPAPYRFPLWGVAAILVPGVLALRSMREFDTGQNRTAIGEAATRPGRVPLWPIVVLALCIFMQATSQGATTAFFNVYLDAHLSVATSTIGAISAASQLLSSLAALSTPLLAKRWGNRQIFAWGSAGVGLAMLPLALVPHWTAAALGFLGVVALNGVAFPAINVYQMQLVSAEWRTTVSGSTAMASGLSWSTSSFFGGQAISGWGYRPFFLLSGGVTLGGALIFGLYFAARERSTGEGMRSDSALSR